MQRLLPLTRTSTPLPHVPTQNRSHCFFDVDDVPSLSGLMKKPYHHFIEMREYMHLTHILEFIRSEYPHASLSLTSATAFRQPVSDLFVHQLGKQRPFTAHAASEIRTCVQEAVMNAIIHGNLGIEPVPDDGKIFWVTWSALPARSKTRCRA